MRKVPATSPVSFMAYGIPTMPAPTMAVMRLAVHPTRVDLCSGSTVGCGFLLMLGGVMLDGESNSRSWSLKLPLETASLEDTRRGARKGDFGGNAGIFFVAETTMIECHHIHVDGTARAEPLRDVSHILPSHLSLWIDFSKYATILISRLV